MLNMAACIAMVVLTGCLGFGQRQPWKNPSLSPDLRADLVMKQMTLDEKIQLVHGEGGWQWNSLKRPPGALGEDVYLPGIRRLGIPELHVNGAGVGVTNWGRRANGQSTALPSSLAETATWDPTLAYDFGAVIGKETRDEGFNVSIGGGVDLARDPRDGRNFEYHGEDPILAGTMLAQELRGIQDQHIVATIKHYALNDQESGRTSVSANIDKRSMRETDLLAFEIGIKESDVGVVMCAYNRVNGIYSCQNSYLLNDVLKNDWGFKGWVMSDWGATHSTVDAALSGLDQEVSERNKYFSNALKAAVEDGDVRLPVLDNMVHRILRTMFASGAFDHPPVIKPINAKADAAVAERVEENGAVLLKNAGGLLPLNALSIHSIAIIGSHADKGVLSGGGSAQVDPVGGNAIPPPNGVRGSHLLEYPVWDPSPPLAAIRDQAPDATVRYDPGTDASAAAKLAAASDVAIVFVDQWTHEAADLPNLSLPGDQDRLVREVAAANPHTIVVLETGDPVLMPWLEDVGAVLEAWYPGQRGGQAIANLLFGKANPSGKLPITFPKSESDLPHPHIQKPPPGGGYFDVDYTEGLKVGYKWFEANQIKPLFPFGYGLSYTTFAFSNLQISPAATDASRPIRVSFDLKNNGPRAGIEVAQIYLGFPASVGEPPKRLVGWARVELSSGQTKTVNVTLDPHSPSHPFSFWNDGTNGWTVANGEYEIFVGDSSQNIYLAKTIHIRLASRRSAVP